MLLYFLDRIDRFCDAFRYQRNRTVIYSLERSLILLLGRDILRLCLRILSAFLRLVHDVLGIAQAEPFLQEGPKLR